MRSNVVESTRAPVGPCAPRAGVVFMQLPGSISNRCVPLLLAVAVTTCAASTALADEAAALEENIAGITIDPNAQGLSPSISIRCSSTSGVATYLDEVPIPNTTAISNALFDMDSVEVLRDPQRTLFGVNTTAGAVVFRPNKPTDKLEG